jgi:hypothetical protein
MNSKQIETFKNPGNEYRGAPFWAWNGKLDPQELRRQIQVMHRMGLGGFFMHSRVGLDTTYLSKEWFACVDACVDEAKKLGMGAWLYDEDRWPSGAAGGLVTKNPKCRMRSAMVKMSDTAKGFKWTPDTLAVFVARIEGAVARQVRQVPRNVRPPKLAEGEKLVAFVVELQPCSSWYNGYTYLDTLSHAAVKEFIKVTHEAYRKRCGKEFGKTIPGMFTDEPNHGNKLGHDNNTAKQVTSAAHQFGAKWRLTETYGCTGWDFPFAGHKALGDWQAAMGINLRCQHLSWYTMSGEAKRDYPAAIFYQSPWWELYPKVEDYFARIHAVMTQGEEVRDLLVIHPVESMWMMVKTGWHGHTDTHAFNDLSVKLTDRLLAEHVDFDFGDEEVMSRHAAVVKASGAPVVRVGQGRYKAVLVPPMKTMRHSTLSLLKKFKAAGGVVSFVGEIASAIEGTLSDEVKAFAATCPHTPEINTAVTGTVAVARRLTIAGPDGREISPALYLLREDKDAFYLFVCNTGEDFVNAACGQMGQPLARERKLAFDDVRIRGFEGCAGLPLELNPESTAIVKADAVRAGDGWEIRTALPALGSRMFVIPRKASANAAAERPAAPQTVRSEALGDESWRITLSECSNLVLDRPRYRIGDKAWQDQTEILRVDKAVRDALGVQHRGGNMVQPWAQEKSAKPKSTKVVLSYTFDCQALPSGELFLALEEPQTFRVSLNGQAVTNTAECGWWVDRSLRKLPLDTACLKLGANELVLECEYAETHPGLEIVYLLGHFGTAVRDTAVALTAAPAALKIGDWCEQGLAFYSGSVAYRRTLDLQPASGEKVFVRVPDYRGVAVRVLVNGQTAGIIGWEPNEVEITALLTGAPVELAIEVIGHRRNSHGPFHIATKWPWWTGPGEFAAWGENWFEGYQLVPCGLMTAPVVDVRK